MTCSWSWPLTLALLASAACSKHPASGPGSAITIDGSSTVFPILEAVAEEYQRESHARITIGVSGTGGGFKKFCNREVLIAGASRAISPGEVRACEGRGVEFIELPIAYDGIAIVVHPQNTWLEHTTVAELKRIWEPAAQGKVTRWSDVRAGFPERELHLFGPGVDSGTYDYFTHAIVGVEHASRGDFTSSEDDNVIIQGVATDPGGLAFVSHAYYAENREKLRLVAVDDGVANNGAGPILPSAETVATGTYQPLCRPVFMYVSRAAAGRRDVAGFVHFSLTRGGPLVEEAGHIPLPEGAYALATRRFDAGVTGSLFADRKATIGATVEALLAGH